MEQFVALPYEIAHAVVRTLVMHSQKYHDAKNDLKEQMDADPTMKKSKTLKAKETWEGLQSVDRYAVMNKRTAWIATPEWLSKYMVVGDNGEPKLKNEKSKVSAWILTLRITASGSEVDLQLRPRMGAAFRTVRCLDLRSGYAITKLGTIMAGYDHLLDEQSGDGVEE